ncbi:MAG: hypothetical protein NVSMB13_15900 [Mycobacteriales bacterium]
MTVVRRLARPMLAAVFITGGADTLRNPAPRVEKAENLNLTNPEKMTKVNAGAMVLGGLALATGRLPRTASAVLAGSLVPTTLAGHRFWEESDAQAKAMQQAHFFKNVGLIGGLMLAAVDTEGRESKPRQAKRAARKAAQATRDAAQSTAEALHIAG